VGFSLKNEILVILSKNMNVYVYKQKDEEFKE
jgi:hypothetical protein